MSNKAIIKVVLYLRLSDEDRDKLTKEQLSESIKNQEVMLREYAKERDWEVIGVYNDEDWSGSDKTRPEFNKMINECESGNVDIVLVKSQSRFARDMELVEKYVHNLFHQWNVRFVTLMEKIDNTKRETKKTSQIIGLTDQWYLEDTSINIRETLKTKRKNGQFTGSFTKYGYIKDPENKNHLVVDPIASLVVKRIYNEYILGKGTKKIAEDLNNDKILSPYEYKHLNGQNINISLIKDFLDYGYIDKAGLYMLDINFINNEDYVQKDLISFNYITTNMKVFNNKCDIVLKKYTDNKVKIYYSEKENLDINNINIDDYILLKENEVIPKTAKVIMAYIKELDRTHMVNYEFEINLNENRSHDKYFVKIVNNKNLKFTYNLRKKFKWGSQTIRQILTDEVYIGNLIQFKTTTVSYKNHTLIRNSENERIRKNNTHEPIIDKETFYTVKERMQERVRSCKNGKLNIFSNKIYCSNCNQIFRKCGTNNKNGLGYLCCTDKKDKWANCDNNKWLSEEKLHNIVLNKINSLLDKFYDEEVLNKMNKEIIEEDLFEDKLNSLKKELNIINKELDGKSKYLKNLYEDRTKGILPEKEFLTLLNKYKDDNSKLEDRASIIENELKITNEKKHILKTKENIFKKYKHIDKLNIEIINTFIDKILIGKYDDKNNTREIKIIWNFTI